MKEKLKRYKKIIILILAVVAIMVLNGVMMNIKTVMIFDEHTVIETRTLAITVAQVLDQHQLTLQESDYIYPAPDERIKRHEEIIIKRSVPVTIEVDGEVIPLMTYHKTIDEALSQADIILSKQDILNYSLEEAIEKDMQITITRVESRVDTVIEEIDYEEISRPNEQMDKGKTALIQQGVVGEKGKQYSVILHDGNEVLRELITEKILREPVDKITEYGTVKTHKSAEGELFRYEKMLRMRATAYNLSYESCGKHPDHPHYGITFTGMKAQHGVVAVDPNTIPLHTLLYIEGADGSWAYGFSIAGDIGSAVKGDIIDLFYDEDDVMQYGVRPVNVYILK